MISKVVKVKSSSAFNIKSLQDYLRTGHKDEPKNEKERVINSFTLNMYADDLETATQEMMYTASLNERSNCSKYMHLVLSLSDGEKLSNEQWKNVVKDYVKEVGMKGHQVIAVQHNDNGKEHFHLIINRIDTEKHTRVNDYRLFYKLQKFDEEIEKKYNLKRFDHKTDQEIDYQRSALNNAKKIEINSEHQSFLSYLLEHKDEIKNSANSWKELQHKLAEFDCQIVVKGRGLVIKSLNPEHPSETKASSFDRDFSYAKLVKKFGLPPSNLNDLSKSKQEKLEDKQQELNQQKDTYTAKPLTQNAKRIEYTAYFFKKIEDRKDKVLDKGNRLLVKKADNYKTYQDTLKIAKKRFGDGNIRVTGSRSFQQRMMYHALKMKINVKLADPDLQRQYDLKLARINYEAKQRANFEQNYLKQRIREQLLFELEIRKRKEQLKRKAENDRQIRRADQQHSSVKRNQSQESRTSHRSFSR